VGCQHPGRVAPGHRQIPSPGTIHTFIIPRSHPKVLLFRAQFLLFRAQFLLSCALFGPVERVEPYAHPLYHANRCPSCTLRTRSWIIRACGSKKDGGCCGAASPIIIVAVWRAKSARHTATHYGTCYRDPAHNKVAMRHALCAHHRATLQRRTQPGCVPAAIVLTSRLSSRETQTGPRLRGPVRQCGPLALQCGPSG
jgi:hypothetical protein